MPRRRLRTGGTDRHAEVAILVQWLRMALTDLILLITFGLAWWLGLYLLGRDPRNPQLRFAGLGLAAYALALGAGFLAGAAAEPDTAAVITRWGWPLLFMPAVFWTGCLFYLLPEEAPGRQTFDRPVSWGLPLVAVLLYALAGASDLIFTIADGQLAPGPWYPVLVVALGLFMLAALLLLARSFRGRRPRAILGLVSAATLFFGLGLGILLLPANLAPNWLLAPAIGLDLALLGLAIGLLDAFEQGETLMPDFFRSLAVSFFTALIFAGQVALVMALATGFTLAMAVLLLATIIAAVAVQTFADPIQDGLDWLIFRRLPRIRRERADSRAVASAASRSRELLDPATLTEDQLARLTRQALSQMGNLPRLAASPLTRLEIVQARIQSRQADDNTLERAAELKTVLTEGIQRLKPRGQGDFGTADAWRYYNALYFPYVVGLKPYSRRAMHDGLDPAAAEALAWFQSQVPERTLYNWQSAAARLIADNLRELSAVSDWR